MSDSFDDDSPPDPVRIENAYNGYLVYHDAADGEFDFADLLRINGHHMSVSDEAEIECDNVSIVQTHKSKKTAVLDVGDPE